VIEISFVLFVKNYEVFNLNKFVIVDIETTGHSPKKGDRIIQFAGVVIEKGKIVDTYTTYINPEIPISPFITELTGIDNERVAKAPVFHEVAEDILKLLEGACFVAHNVHFDYTFLQEELELNHFPLLDCPVLDTVEMTRIFEPTMESLKLSDIASVAGFDHDRPHQADSDAYVTAEWFLHLLEKAGTFPKRTINQLRKFSKGLRTNLYEILDEIYKKKIENKESLPDHLDIYRGIVFKKQHVFDKARPSINNNNQILKIEDLVKNHTLSSEEMSLIKYIIKCLNDGELALVEPDIHYNKELSYLIAASFISIIKKEPVIISLASVSNQQMITETIMPKLKEILHVPIQIQLLKGKKQYLNLWKFEKVLKDDSQNYDEIITKMQMLVWLTETNTGDVSEINLSSAGLQFLEKLSEIPLTEAEKDNPWLKHDFYKKALSNAREAQVIITNHHFLMSHLTNPNSQMININYCIIDDAHLFEKNAIKYFGKRLSYSSVKYYLNQLGNPDQLKILGRIERLIRDKGIFVKHSTELIYQYYLELSAKSDEFFLLCYNYLLKLKKNTNQGKMSCQFHIRENNSLLYSWERVYDAYKNLYNSLFDRLSALIDLYKDFNDNEKLLVEDFAYILNQLTMFKDMHDEFIMQMDQQRIIFGEADLKSAQTSMVIKNQFLSIHKQLANFYMSKKAILFISNSLTIKNSFTFISKQLGLESFPFVQKQFQTQLNTETDVHLYALNDIPNVVDISEEEYVEVISNHIIAIAQTLQGRIMISFSSYEMLKDTYNLIKDSETLEEFVLLAQGVTSGSIHRLAKQFNRFEKAILFTTATHIEGLLIEGIVDALIIARLPFTSPNDPVFAKQFKVIKSMGKSPFYELSLPDAVLRLKLSLVKFFKLKSKAGSVIIFDKRIYATNYGHAFLESLPGVSIKTVSLQKLCKQLEKNKGELDLD
jgi:ATP-dependent DNA helicase DinG